MALIFKVIIYTSRLIFLIPPYCLIIKLNITQRSFPAVLIIDLNISHSVPYIMSNFQIITFFSTMNWVTTFCSFFKTPPTQTWSPTITRNHASFNFSLSYLAPFSCHIVLDVNRLSSLSLSCIN